jgi:hypothetical protein
VKAEEAMRAGQDCSGSQAREEGWATWMRAAMSGAAGAYREFLESVAQTIRHAARRGVRNSFAPVTLSNMRQGRRQSDMIGCVRPAPFTSAWRHNHTVFANMGWRATRRLFGVSSPCYAGCCEGGCSIFIVSAYGVIAH